MFSKLRPLIFKVDPEKAHSLAIKSLKFNLIPNVFDENKNDSIFQTKIFLYTMEIYLMALVL